jgi:hypothetical protein
MQSLISTAVAYIHGNAEVAFYLFGIAATGNNNKLLPKMHQDLDPVVP